MQLSIAVLACWNIFLTAWCFVLLEQRDKYKRDFETWRDFNFVVATDGNVQSFVRINKRRADLDALVADAKNTGMYDPDEYMTRN